MLVLPPTQSGRLKISSQFSLLAFLYNSLSVIVIAIELEHQSISLSSIFFLIISMAILGSGVPPDLLTTTNRVLDKLSSISINFSLIKKGSTLSINEKFKPWCFF